MSIAITNADSDVVTFADPVTGFTRIAGQYFIGYSQDEAQYALELQTAPATDGQTVHRHGFRDRQLGPILVCYVGVSADACEDLYTADHDNLVNISLGIVFPNGESFPSCILKQFKKIRQPKNTGHSTFRMNCLLAFEQVRLD